jgi:hypothetical protein
MPARISQCRYLSKLVGANSYGKFLSFLSTLGRFLAPRAIRDSAYPCCPHSRVGPVPQWITAPREKFLNARSPAAPLATGLCAARESQVALLVKDGIGSNKPRSLPIRSVGRLPPPKLRAMKASPPAAGYTPHDHRAKQPPTNTLTTISQH